MLWALRVHIGEGTRMIGGEVGEEYVESDGKREKIAMNQLTDHKRKNLASKEIWRVND